MRYVFSVDSPRAAHTHTHTHEAQTKPATNEAASKKKKDTRDGVKQRLYRHYGHISVNATARGVPSLKKLKNEKKCIAVVLSMTDCTAGALRMHVHTVCICSCGDACYKQSSR